MDELWFHIKRFVSVYYEHEIILDLKEVPDLQKIQILWQSKTESTLQKKIAVTLGLI